ncbi:DUF2975 domain-containing protein [Lentibacillus salicampi]|uniref:DUF2975 domain-containing protein n=1 Tax=Lentibacillus salicampi TaxID=175306 RepID=A0A4Y9A8Z5_9BACI|nr:DUF2975 domain-containing protein [Lentibacillus salicampi]TFJ92319.1 DUF2975 domain-containing protein [Lentibacillus salicampi]
MSLNILFKISSLLSLLLFYFVLLTGLFTIVANVSYIWWPDSSFTQSLGEFNPIYGYMTLDFYQQPDLYTDKSFMVLYFISNITLFLFALAFLWLMYKFLKNIYKEGLFMHENVSLLFGIGLTCLVLGSATTYTDGLLLSKAVTALDISNASIAFSNIAYADFIITGFVLMFIASALKTAVSAVEENKQTI